MTDRPTSGSAVAPTVRRRSLDYLTVDGATPVEQITAAAAAGFDSVGLRFLAPTDLVLEHEVLDDPGSVLSIRHACHREGIRPLDVEVFFLGPGVDMARLARAVEVAAEVGAATLLTVIADREPQRALERFDELCDAAASYGLDVALEFMRWSPVPTIEAAVAFLERADRPNAGVCLDALHLSRSGGDPAATPALPRAGTFIQLCDARATIPPPAALLEEARGDRLYPGEGDLPLHELLDVLPPDVPISVEVPHRRYADRSVMDRALLAGEALRTFLVRHEAWRAAGGHVDGGPPSSGQATPS